MREDLGGIFIRYMRVYTHTMVRGSGTREGPLETKNCYRPVGCLVAEATGPSSYRWGWSLCSSKDQFTHEIARRIAIGRMRKGFAGPSLAPVAVAEFFADSIPMIERWLERTRKL